MDRSLAGPWARLLTEKERVLARVAGFTPEARDARPDPARWSVADVVEHLVLVETGMRTALAKDPVPERPRAFPPGHWWRYPALRGALLLGIRIRAPVDVILPRRETSWNVLLERWEEERRLLEEWLHRAPQGILPDPRFRHPLAGWLSVREAMVFAGDHIKHHRAQIGRIDRLLVRTGRGSRQQP